MTSPPRQAKLKLESFKEWMSLMRITWNAQVISFIADAPHCSGLALAIVTNHDVEEGKELCTIPKAACISTKTTGIADIIEAEEIGGGLGLVIATMYEKALGPASKWHGYFEAMPDREYVPMYWNESEAAELQGTELGGTVDDMRQEVLEDYEENVLPLIAKYPDRFGSLENKEEISADAFAAAASLVASRAFGIDDYHGEAMVPLADVFNHKVSVVDLAPGYEVHGADSDSDEDGFEDDSSGQSDDDSDDKEHHHDQPHSHMGGKCGVAGCDHDHEHEHHSHSELSEEEHEDADVFTGVMRDGAVHQVHGLTTANGLHLRLEIAIVDEDEDTLQILAASNVPQGQEIHNTYGELSNTMLVKKYGFALRQNPFTAVALDKGLLVECLDEAAAAGGQPITPGGSTAKGAKKTATDVRKKLIKLVKKETNLLEDDEEPFDVLSNGYVGPALWATLRALRPEQQAGVKSWAAALALTEEERKVATEGATDGSVDVDGITGPVQLWPVRDPEGNLLQAESSGTADTTCPPAPPAGLTLGMCLALQAALNKRMQNYPTSLEESLARLKCLDQSKAKEGQDGNEPTGGLSEHDAAVRAAVLLRITEQEVLQDALAAVASASKYLENVAAKREGQKDRVKSKAGAALEKTAKKARTSK